MLVSLWHWSEDAMPAGHGPGCGRRGVEYPMDLVKSLNQSDFLTPMPPSPGDAGTFDC